MNPDPAAADSSTSVIFCRAARVVSTLVARIPDTAWAGPGLGDWDLRALVGHTSRALLTVESYLSRPAAKIDLADAETYLDRAIAAVDPASITQRGVDAGVALGTDPAAAFSAIVDRVLPLLARNDDPAIDTIAGGMRLSIYLQTRSFELVVHGLDIADALGIEPPAFDPDAWGCALGLATRTAVLKNRAPELIRAVTGRAGLPPGFSVV